ncbi:MAG: NUDIX hydrolase [Vicinamibacterales bacterium]
MPVVFKSRVFSVVTDRMQFPNGSTHEVAIVRHRPSVVLIPLQDDGRVVLIKQFRPSVGRELFELPAGGVDEGELPEAAAERECEEETGLVPGAVERLGGLYPAPGFCDEELIFFKATGLHPPAGEKRRADDDEHITTKVMPLEEARQMVKRGEIVDLKTAYGLMLV